MKLKKLVANTFITAFALTLTACGSKKADSAELTEFRNNVDSFCETISTIDSNINSLETIENANELLSYLDQLKVSFDNFAEMDFPSDYDYLEGVADEAGSYMETAVSSYHEAFEKCETAESFQAKYDYATENYSRAYKRVKVIMSFLNGEKSEDATYEEVSE